MTNKIGKAPYHQDLNDCPLQCKIIADAIQGYVLADPFDHEDLFDPVFLDWGYGPYWAIAKQLISNLLLGQFADILEGAKDRSSLAHRIVFYFWDQDRSVTADELQMAQIVSY